jgi:hypothetical protein
MCWRDDDVATVLNSDEVLGRDERLLLLGLLDKCSPIDDDAQELDPAVSVDGCPVFDSYGIALVHADGSSSDSYGRAVLSLAHRGRSGARNVVRGGRDVAVFFLVDFVDERLFWRSVYELANVPERQFFELAPRAFPNLLFASTLNFGRFAGLYATVREEVVRHLGALNDTWTVAYVEEAGNSDRISARIGIDVSRESGLTRAAEGLMRQRDVPFHGRKYRCEWHSKLEPDRNRIHFHPAGESIEHPLIGIFCDHLDTGG